MVVGETIDSTKKKCQKIVNFQGYRLWKKSKICYIQYPQTELYVKMLSQNCQQWHGNHLKASEFHYNEKQKNPQNRKFPKALGLEKSQKKVIFLIPQNEA